MIDSHAPLEPRLQPPLGAPRFPARQLSAVAVHRIFVQVEHAGRAAAAAAVLDVGLDRGNRSGIVRFQLRVANGAGAVLCHVLNLIYRNGNVQRSRATFQLSTW